uniref:Uncharacterized protein n=1 Tax=Arundo donax TaxID=35708 RepID=A0A0A9FQ45_ARUDO
MTCLIAMYTEGVSLLKTQLFRCFHNSQAAKMIRLFRPFLHFLSTPRIALHHQLEEDVCDAKSWSPSL